MTELATARLWAYAVELAVLASLWLLFAGRQRRRRLWRCLAEVPVAVGGLVVGAAGAVLGLLTITVVVAGWALIAWLMIRPFLS